MEFTPAEQAALADLRAARINYERAFLRLHTDLGPHPTTEQTLTILTDLKSTPEHAAFQAAGQAFWSARRAATT